LYTTAIAAAFFIPLTYDIVATFLLVLSLHLYLKKKVVSAYFSAMFGTLMKWIPILSFPFFFLNSVKNGESLKETKNGIIVSIIVATVFSIPFLLMNPDGFLFTYTFHLNRSVQTHSFVYYADAISRFLFHGDFFSPFSFILLIVVEICLMAWYYRILKNDSKTLVYVIFLSVFFFMIFNKVFSASYIIWVTPFLALLLVHSVRKIILFYLIQLIFYIETPLLYRIVFGDGKPYYVVENNFLTFSFIFYSVKFLILAILLWVILRDVSAMPSRISQ